MKFSNAHYGEKLIGRQVSSDLLLGRDYRPDKHRLFSDAQDGENVWYKTFSVGLDKSCQEAYFILGLLLGTEGTVRDVGAGVMYMDSGTGSCMFSFSSREDSEADVDDMETDDPDGTGDDGQDADEGTDTEDEEEDDEDDESGEEAAHAKRVMDVLPLDWMLSEKMPCFLEHEAEMIIKGRWLPKTFTPEGAPLPKYLADRFITGAPQENGDRYPILDEISFEIKRDLAHESFEGSFDILANRGTRYFVCSFGGRPVDGEWRIDDFNVDSYASTVSGFGNLFTRPSSLGDNEHDHRQACLLLVDFYDDKEFNQLLK